MSGRLVIFVGLLLLCTCYRGCRTENKNEERKDTLPSHTTAPAEEREREKDYRSTSREVSGEALLVHIRNSDDFQRYVLDSKAPCLVDFYSEYCPPCRMLAPIIEKLAREYKGKVVVCKVSLDISDTRDVAARYSFRYIPTVIFFRGGKEVDRMTGLKPEGVYRKILDKMLTGKASGGK